jgi:tetratricopeptide (TPR) repeat protein
LTKRPDLPQLAYNAGNALDRLGKFDRAVDESRRALPPTSVDLGEKTYFSLGNHFLGLNRPQEAVDAYRSALLLDPADTDAKYNYELALRILQSQQQQQQQPNTGSQPSDGQPNAGQNAPPNSRGGDPSEAPDQAPQPAAGSGQGAPSDNSNPQAPTAAQAQRSLEQALAGINDNPSVEDAIHVLDLLQQLNAAQRNRQPATPGGGPDY